MTAPVHTFKDQLHYAQSQDLDSWWNARYAETFPGLSGIVRNHAFGRAQLLGVDTVLVLPNGKTITLDEKTRKTWYGDIALEHTSSTRPFKPGWIEKDLAIDYLAYGVPTEDRCFFLPWPILRAAWIANRDQWKSQYPDVVAKNPTYSSLSTPVPLKVLLVAMSHVMAGGLVHHSPAAAGSTP